MAEGERTLLEFRGFALVDRTEPYTPDVLLVW
jgi:hypothetical protein